MERPNDGVFLVASIDASLTVDAPITRWRLTPMIVAGSTNAAATIAILPFGWNITTMQARASTARRRMLAPGTASSSGNVSWKNAFKGSHPQRLRSERRLRS